MGEIRLIITDLDGTLVDSYLANFMAYKEVFEVLGLSFDESTFSNCFGYSIDLLLKSFKINSIEKQDLIKTIKTKIYPKYFKYLNLNQVLLDFIIENKKTGCQIVLATSASKSNAMAVLDFFEISSIFDLILTRDDVRNPKPNPEIFNLSIQKLKEKKENTLVFEDSDIGCEAANLAGINYIRINFHKKNIDE